MKPRLVALLLLATMLLLVGMIPAVGAQRATPTPERQAIPDREQRRERAAAAAKADRAKRQPEAPPPAEPTAHIDPLRAERHPEENRRPEVDRPAPTTGVSPAARLSIAAALNESEPNNDWTTANAIAIGDVASGVIDPTGDWDYYAITVAAGDYLQFSIAARAIGSDLDSVITLYDTDGVSQLAYNDDSNGLDSRISYLFSGAGTYYLRVRNYGDYNGGPEYWYELSVIDLLDIDTVLLRASVDAMGQDSNGYSYDPAISADGRFVAFSSDADNLVPGDWNEMRDIFVRDTQANTIERVSVSSGGDEANANSYRPSISADGRYVAFQSWADNLVNNDLNESADVFLHDRQTGTTTLISRHSDGTPGNWDSYNQVISADGRFVAFESYADNLVDDDANGGISDIFLYETATGDVTLVSRHSDGTQGNAYSYSPAISADGRFVAFESYADNLVDDDENDYEDVFVRDVAGGTTTLVSRHSDGDQGDDDSYDPSLSADGQVVAFESYAGNLVDDDSNGYADVFIHNLQTGTTSMVSRHSDGTPGNGVSYRPALSGDGRYVTFYSGADNLIDFDANGTVYDVFLHDLQTNETTLVSKSVAGTQGNWYSYYPAINEDGSVVAFLSEANNLVPFDRNSWVADVFVRYTGLPETHTISGRVTDEDGDGACCSVIVRDNSGAAAYTNDDGYYVLAGLLPGDHGVWAWDEWYYLLFPNTPEAVTLPPDAADVDITGAWNDYYGESFPAVADAFVDESKKTKNFGTQPYLRVKNAAKDLNSYLKFEVDGIGSCAYIDYSYLKLFATDGGPDGGDLYMTGNDWTEKGITWKNAPPLGSYRGWLGALADNSYAYAHSYITGNGVYSFAIRNYSSDMVQYDSREGANGPTLIVEWLPIPEQMPDARYEADIWNGTAPLTVQFTDNSTGCPTSWHWDFGDGHTSTDQNPTHTYTTPGNYPVVLTVTNSLGTDKKTRWIEVYEPPSKFYMSLSKKATVGGIVAEPADIVLYDRNSNSWQMVYDGSVRGTKANISSFAWDGDDLLIVFSGNQTITGLGKATQYDVVRFTPNTPGVFPLGPGVFDWEFQGKPNGLTKGSEKIDALGYYWGDLLMSTTGKADLPTNPVLKADKEDLLGWYRGSQQWADYLYLDGSQIPGMAGKNVNGVWYDSWTGDYYVVIAGKFDLGGGVKGNDANIVRLSWSNGQWTPSLVNWLAPGAPAFKGKIDAIELAR